MKLLTLLMIAGTIVFRTFCQASHEFIFEKTEDDEIKCEFYIFSHDVPDDKVSKHYFYMRHAIILVGMDEQGNMARVILFVTASKNNIYVQQSWSTYSISEFEPKFYQSLQIPKKESDQ